MNCLNKTQLEQFLAGKLDPETLISVDEHLSACPECRAALMGSIARAKASAEISATLLGVRDCPEYEELSAYVDKALAIDREKSIRAHVNSCELCARDVARIEELRSHAALREKIIVTPGASRSSSSPRLIWKRAAALLGSAAVVVGVAISLSNMSNMAFQVADNPTKPPVTHNQNSPEHVAQTPDKPNNTQPVIENNTKPTPNVPTSNPASVALLNDGKYKVVRKNGDLALASNSRVEARVAAAIDAKLRTGKVKPSGYVRVAMAGFSTLRGQGYKAPSTAPKLIGPSDDILIDATPTLKWSSVDLAESYLVEVFDKEGRVVFEKEISGTQVTPNLQRGRSYIWHVRSKFAGSDEWYTSATATFYVLSAEEYDLIQDAKTQLPGSHLALGAVYESLGLKSEAAAEYRALAKENPGSKIARRLIESL